MIIEPMEVKLYIGVGWGGMDVKTMFEPLGNNLLFKIDNERHTISYLDIERLYHMVQLDKIRQAQEIEDDR
jgi:hypothetical protein